MHIISKPKIYKLGTFTRLSSQSSPDLMILSNYSGRNSQAFVQRMTSLSSSSLRLLLVLLLQMVNPAQPSSAPALLPLLPAPADDAAFLGLLHRAQADLGLSQDYSCLPLLAAAPAAFPKQSLVEGHGLRSWRLPLEGSPSWAVSHLSMDQASSSPGSRYMQASHLPWVPPHRSDLATTPQ